MAPNKEKSVLQIVLEEYKNYDLLDFDYEEPDEVQLNDK
jgi:hypothetical protein